MYYPIGWPKKLNVNPSTPSDLVDVLADHQREIFLILTTTSIHLWYSRPIVEIVCHQRSAESIEKLGFNKLAAWRPDSSTIVVATTLDHLLFYEIRQRLPSTNPASFLLSRTLSSEDVIYRLKDRTPGSGAPGRIIGPGTAGNGGDPVPALMLFLFGKLDLSPIGVSTLMAADEELVVASRTRGDIYGVLWDGSVDEHFPWSLRDTSLANQENVVVDIKYSSILSGFALVMSNGQGAFIPTALSFPEQSASNSSDASPKSVVIEIHEVCDATCTTLNHKYKLIAFGLRSSKAIVCNITNDASSTEPVITINHELILPSNRYPDIVTRCGFMSCIEYTPDQMACITAWQNGGFAVWSVFGSLLACSYSWDPPPNLPRQILSMVWGRHGYSLWMLLRETNHAETNDKGSVAVMSFVKSALASNPDLACSTESIMLIGDDRLYVDVAPFVGNEIATSHDLSATSSTAATNPSSAQQFTSIDLPVTYLSANWPIRYATIDKMAKNVAIAGRLGIAHYSLMLRRWRIFNNEAQERDFEVCGGIMWWSNFIILSCYNISSQQFELRAYPSSCKLDTNNATVMPVNEEIILMSTHQDKLLLLNVNGVFKMYSLARRAPVNGLPPSANTVGEGDELVISYINQIVLTNFNLDLDHLASIALTTIHSENERNDDSVLLNISGKLFLLENETKDPERYRISVLVTNVENFWISSDEAGSKHEKPYLTRSLWVHRGAVGGLEVWLPLLSDLEAPRPPHQYMPERIMLSVNLGASFYPLSIMFHDAIALGAENDTMNGAPSICSYPYQTVSKRSQVYLHHILRELLSRNLGYHAWELARQHELLPYFAHSFELLLHEVLEAEATTSQLLTDPLLPMIVKFISEFPVYLETVVHCARKTDVALWPHLFSVVGNPRRLFQRCLTENKLDIAASCIIILHTFERKNVTQQMVAQLLDAARADKRYHYLIDDLESFMTRVSSSPDNNNSTTSSLAGMSDDNIPSYRKDSIVAIETTKESVN